MAAEGGSSRRGLFRSAAQAAMGAVSPSPATEGGGLTIAELDRYSRQLVLDGWGVEQQRALRDASVLVVGAGALGSPVATYLAGAGVGRIGIADDDTVELANLHRQFLHDTPQIGHAKAHNAVTRLQRLNPEVMVEAFQVRLDADNAEGLVVGHDLVVDCSDGFATRYVVNHACCVTGQPLVEGGVVGLSGLVMSIRPGETACYRCVFPAAPANAASCAEAGVLGPSAGVIGSLMALEVMKLIAGLPGALLDAFLQVDLSDCSFLRVDASRRPNCRDCG